MPGGLTFGILGPLRIERGRETLAPSGPRQQAVLAALLLRANEVVSTDSLIEAVWGEEPPATARTALQVHVSKLRRLLDGDRRVEIQTVHPGYRIRVDAGAVDALRFGALVDEGVDALRDGDNERAVGVLARALALWRGHPLEAVDAPGIPPSELIELEEHKVRAAALLAEASLATGRHAEALPDLERLHSEHPLDERVASLTALALYRSGRQSDALDVLAHLRRELSTELGAEPGPAVADLERRILAHDPSLDSERPVVEASPVRVGRKSVTALVVRLPGPPDGDPEAELPRRAGATVNLRETIEEQGGAVGESRAGRVTAIFGIPLANEDDAVRSLRVAGQALDVVDGLRVGVATGEVLIEDQDGVQRLLSTGPIEAADDLAASAEAGAVFLDARTERLTRGHVISEPVTDDAFRLVNPEPVQPGAPAFLVGRASELAALEHTFTRVTRERSASLVTVLGSAGVGKSTLVAAFLGSLEGATTATGRCLAYGREISFWPVAEIVRQLAGLGGSEDPESVSSRVAELLGDDPDATFIARQVAAVIGTGSTSPAPDELHWAIRRFLESVASEQPLVLVFEDLQWADDTLLDLVTYLATWIKDAPVMVVCAARPELLEQRASWGAGRLDAVNLSLDTLSKPEADELIDTILGGELDREVRSRIHETAEGHPLFIGELLSMLRDEGAIVEKDGRWVAVEGVTSLQTPPTVRAVLDARLDRSSPSQRRVLEFASIAGRDFTLADLASFGDIENLMGILEELVGRDLIVAERGSRAARAYRFRHILLRDAAYAGIPKEGRARDHEAFASALEAREEERIAGFDEIVGYHLESAHGYAAELGGDVDRSLADRAATHLASAARRALEIEDMPAAASLASRARALIDAMDHRYPGIAWIEAVALFDLGRTAEVEVVLDDGVVSARELGDESMEWRLRVEQLDVRLWLAPEAGGEHIRAAREAIEVFERLGDVIGLARALRILGDALHFENRFDEAVRAFERGHRLALESGDEREASQRPAFGVVHGPMPVASCIEIVESSMQSAPRPNPDGMGHLALLYAMDGRPDEARDMAERAVTRARELGEWRAAAVEMYAAVAYLTLNDPVAAETVVRPAVEALRAIGERNLLSTAAALLGEARMRQSDLDEAMAMSLLSERSSAADDHIAAMQWRGLRGKVLAARGDHLEAERLALAACRIAREGARDAPHLAGDAFLDLSFVLEAAGRLSEASNAAEEAIARYEAKGDRTSASRAEVSRERLRLEATRSGANDG